MFLVAILAFSVLGWVLTGPDGKATTKVKNEPKDVHRKMFLEKHGWTSTEIPATGKIPEKAPDPAIEIIQADGFKATVTLSSNQKVKSIRFGEDEPITIGKAKRDDLFKLATMAGLEVVEDETADSLKTILNDWVASGGNVMRRENDGRPKESTDETAPEFEVFCEVAEGKSVIKSFAINGEETYLSKSTKAQLTSLATMAGLEVAEDATVDGIKAQLTEWAQNKSESIKFVGT